MSWRSLGFGRLALLGVSLHSSVNRISKCWKRRTGHEAEECSALIHRNPRAVMSLVDNLVRFVKHKVHYRSRKSLCYLILAVSKGGQADAEVGLPALECTPRRSNA